MLSKRFNIHAMKEYVRTYGGFSCVIVIETVFILLIVLNSLGKTTEIRLDADNLIIYDDNVTIDEYEEIDTMALDDNMLVVYDNKASKDIEKSLYISGRNDENPYGRWIVGSDLLIVGGGMYELEVKYYSLVYDNEVGGNSNDSTALIQIISEDNQSKIYYNEMTLRDGITVNSTRVWVRSLRSIDDMEIKVNFYGIGDLRIDSITLKEMPMWRVLKVIAWLAFFAIIDILYAILFTRNTVNNKDILVALVGMIFFSSLPMAADYLLKGHDMDFHVARIWALAENIKAGQWAFPLQTEMANGYGYASPLFYGQIFLYIPAIIYNMGAPIQVCYQLYVIMVNVATVIISWFCFKGITKDSRIGVVGSFLYTFSAYRISNVYLRAALGEYTAMMFYPLILWGFIRVYTKSADKINWKDCILIVAGLTGLIQSHILSCELAAIFIILFCVIYIKKTFEPRRFVSLVSTVIVTVALNMAFLVPFLSSMTMDIRVKSQEAENIQHYGTYLIQVFGIFMTSQGDTVTGMANEMPLAMGFSLLLGSGLFLWCCVKKYDWNLQKDVRIKIGVVCVAFTAVCIVLSTRFFPWDSIEEISTALAKLLSTVQFPWRYLSIATVFAATASCIAVMILKEKKGTHISRKVSVMLVSLALLCCGLFYLNFADSAETYKVYGGADVEQDTVGGEYMLTGTIEGYMSWRSVIADLENVGIAMYESDHGQISFICTNISESEEIVQIPILNYDNYHAYTSDGTELEIENGDNNRLAIVVPAKYEGMIMVKYEIPLLWKISYIISFAVFIMIVALIVCNKCKYRVGREVR